MCTSMSMPRLFALVRPCMFQSKYSVKVSPTTSLVTLRLEQDACTATSGRAWRAASSTIRPDSQASETIRRWRALPFCFAKSYCSRMPLSPRDLPSDNFQEPRCPWKLPYRICRSDFVEKKSFKDSMALLNVSLPPKTRVAGMFHSAGQRPLVPHRGLHKTSACSLWFVMA